MRDSPQARGERPPDVVTGQDFPRMFRNKFPRRNTTARESRVSLRCTCKGKPVVVIPVHPASIAAPTSLKNV